MSSRFAVADYASAARALMPRGRAWNEDPASVQARLLGGVAASFVRSDASGSALLDSSKPGDATVLLPEWEATLGLPDACVPFSPVFSDRQAAAGNKIASTGGQTRTYLIDQAARIGVQIAIDEYYPFRAGDRAGRRCLGPGWQFVFQVRVLKGTDTTGTISVTRFRAGASSAGDRLRIGGLAGLECIIRRAAPAHTTVVFKYPETGA